MYYMEAQSDGVNTTIRKSIGVPFPFHLYGQMTACSVYNVDLKLCTNLQCLYYLSKHQSIRSYYQQWSSLFDIKE